MSIDEILPISRWWLLKFKLRTWRIPRSGDCPRCKQPILESVSSRRYTHENLWSAENYAFQSGIEAEKMRMEENEKESDVSE